MMSIDEFIKFVGPLDEPLTKDMLIPLIIYLMRATRDIRGIGGHNKKRLVMAYIEQYLDESTMSWKGIIPDIIDSFVDIEKGNLKINKGSWCSNCISLKIQDHPFRFE